MSTVIDMQPTGGGPFKILAKTLKVISWVLLAYGFISPWLKQNLKNGQKSKMLLMPKDQNDLFG